jgi:hypothetical protein
MKIQNRQQALLFAAIACVALLAGNWLIWTPLSHLWTARAAQVAKLRGEIRDGTMLRQRSQYIHNRWTQIQNSSLTKSPSLAEQQMFKAIDNWSADSRADIAAITPQWKNDQDDHSTLDCRVEVSGDYSAVSKFLYDLERDPLAIQVESLELAARDNTGQEFTLNVQISGLMLNF